MNNVSYISKDLLQYSEIAGAVKSDIQRIAGNGQFFTAYFYKRNEKTRMMNCRLSVKKHLKGGKKSGPEYDNRLTVWDRNTLNYRTISLDRLECLVMAGKTVYFN